MKTQLFYDVSAVVGDGKSLPWRCDIQERYETFDDAIEALNKLRRNLTVYSGTIKTTGGFVAYSEIYVNVIGTVRRPGGKK